MFVASDEIVGVMTSMNEVSEELGRSYQRTRNFRPYGPVYWSMPYEIDINIVAVDVMTTGVSLLRKFSIERFDLTVCCVAFDRRGIEFTSSFLEDITTGNLR